MNSFFLPLNCFNEKIIIFFYIHSVWLRPIAHYLVHLRFDASHYEAILDNKNGDFQFRFFLIIDSINLIFIITDIVRMHIAIISFISSDFVPFSFNFYRRSERKRKKKEPSRARILIMHSRKSCTCNFMHNLSNPSCVSPSSQYVYVYIVGK